jgi:hypothetical protein
MKGADKMAREILTDAEVEKEIEKLLDSYHVQLAKKEQRIRYRRRQYLYQLRNLEKHGKELEAAGITYEMLDDMDKDIERATE